MEIERKFTVKTLPDHLEDYPHSRLTQAYLCTDPVLRIRRDGEGYIFTYKGSGLMVREEYNLPLTREAFDHLLPKADGAIIEKTRYRIPLAEYAVSNGEKQPLTAELDLFTLPKPLQMVEVEFPDEESARSFIPPDWFGEDVTDNPAYHNSNMIGNKTT